MEIKRSMNNVSGDITITDGDVIVTDKTKGVVMTDQNDNNKRLKIVDEGGFPTTEIEDVL